MSRFPTCLRLSKLVFDHKSCRTPMFKKLNVDRLSLTPYIQERGKLTWDGTFSLFSTASASSDTKPQEPTSGKTEQTIQENKNSTDSSLEELNKTLEVVTKQKEELDDKYKRALAESENIRKRLTKQIEDAKVYAIQSFCKDLLDVADVLSKATECVPKEEVKESNPHLKNLYEGLTMTEAQLHKVFQRHGLTPVNPLNEKFNPNLHEALFQQEVEGKDAGTVVVVSKIGYKLHERVVRPALVGVAKG